MACRGQYRLCPQPQLAKFPAPTQHSRPDRTESRISHLSIYQTCLGPRPRHTKGSIIMIKLQSAIIAAVAIFTLASPPAIAQQSGAATKLSNADIYARYEPL